MNLGKTMWNYNGTSIVDVGAGLGEHEYVFFTINTQEDFSGLIDDYRAILGRSDYILDKYKYETFEDNKELSPNVKLAMKEHNANVCLTLLEDKYLDDCLRVRQLVVNREISEGKYDTSFFNLFYFPVADNANAYFERGRAYQEMGYDFAAVMCYTYAIGFDPNEASTYLFRAIAYVEMDDYDSAIKDYTQAIKLDPNDAKTHTCRGGSYVLKGNHTAAIDDFSQAIKLDPNAAMAYAGRGFVYKATGDHDSAIKDLTQAIKLYPNYANIYALYGLRGFSYFWNGNVAAAIDDFSQAIKINPNYALAYTSRGHAYAKIGDYDSAIKDCTQAIKLYPNYAKIYAIYGLRGISYFWNRNCAAAFDDFSQAIKINPNVAMAHIYRGLMYAAASDFYSARADYIKAIESDPNDEIARKLLKALDNKIAHLEIHPPKPKFWKKVKNMFKRKRRD
ncbi:MAG: tetratricopeptide repeat protein [Treponema sp.]|nr:tetratricopeptide repeat protein [Treponema sp.]